MSFLSVVGLIYLVSGFILNKYPPKKINQTYGYRTKESMKSQAKWNFAQTYSSKLLTFCSTILFPFGIIFNSFIINQSIEIVIGLFLISISIFLIFTITENALKNISE